MSTLMPRVALIASVALTLSGCANLFHIGSARSTSNSTLAETKADVWPSATEEGRRNLSDGQTGLAVESFQRALSGGEAPAPALNGLGVAFARLGNFETAERFFQEATALDPANAVYSANMTKLVNSAAFAMRRQGDRAARSADANPLPANSGDLATASTSSATGRLTRVSRNEYRVQTFLPSGRMERQGPAVVSSGFKPVVRIQLSDPVPVGERQSRRRSVTNPFAAVDGGDTGPALTNEASARAPAKRRAGVGEMAL